MERPEERPTGPNSFLTSEMANLSRGIFLLDKYARELSSSVKSVPNTTHSMSETKRLNAKKKKAKRKTGGPK